MLIFVGGWVETGGFYLMMIDLVFCLVNMEGIKVFNKLVVDFIC